VIGRFLAGGAGVAAAKVMTVANDHLRKALCAFGKQFRQSGSDPICYSFANQPAVAVLEKHD
jgi:hypothetical protein